MPTSQRDLASFLRYQAKLHASERAAESERRLMRVCKSYDWRHPVPDLARNRQVLDAIARF